METAALAAAIALLLLLRFFKRAATKYKRMN